MSILHVRNVPVSLYQAIQERARQQRRSMSAEVILLLQEALWNRQAQEELLADIRQRRSFRPADVGAPDSTTLLREDRER
jgi:plasmid stability protein